MIEIDAKANEDYVLEKLAKISTSVDKSDSLTDLTTAGYDELKERHKEKWDEIWDIS